MTALSTIARRFINRYQGGLPLERRPFAAIARVLQADEEEVIGLVSGLIADGYLSRFGPLFDASRLGGGQTLAALSVPEKDYDAVAEAVNDLPQVAHNYRREHALNMWFVVAATTPGEIQRTLDAIQRRTGLEVLNLPKQHEFYVGLWLQLGDSGQVDTVPVPEPTMETSARSTPILDDLDYRIIGATQTGLPVIAEPFDEVAGTVGASTRSVLERMARMLEQRVIRRIGAVPNHYRLGLRGNGMSVWDVPDDLAVETGTLVGRLPYVSHAYLRPRHDGIWPYNLFAMVHGRGRDEVLEKTTFIDDLIGDRCRRRDLLFSSRVLKKTGLRLAA